jgi:four helix bundle protein
LIRIGAASDSEPPDSGAASDSERPRKMSGDDDDTQAKPPLAGRRAAPAQPPVVALRMETLLTWTAERVAKFPRDHKFTVGDRLVETCLDIMSNLVEASYKRDKQALLTSASRALVRARVLVRLARSLRCLSESQQVHFDKESVEIGRMLGGWIRSVQMR